MLNISKAFWAKKQDSKGRFEWLSLAQHLEDTRQISRLLWMHWLSKGQREFIISSIGFSLGNCTSIEVSSTAKSSIVASGDVNENGRILASEEDALGLLGFLAAAHDIGKATPAFQIKRGFQNSKDLDDMLIDKLEGDGFSTIRQTRLSNPEKSPHALAGQYLLSTYGVSEDISSIVGAHHGKPVDNSLDEGFGMFKKESQGSYISNYYEIEDSNHPTNKKWKKEQQRIFDRALKVEGYKSLEELPKVEQPAQVLLSGLIIMADWIASNEEYFPLLPMEVAVAENQDARVERGFTKWLEGASYPWQADADKPNKPKGIDNIYKYRFGFEDGPRNAQRVLAETIEDTKEPGIFIFEAPMGLGKTEAALVAVEQLAEKTGRSGIFFGLPTQATSNGIFPRINAWLESISGDENEKLGLRLLHGKAMLNPDFDNIIKRTSAKNINIDEGEAGGVTVNEWFSGRKTAALDDFVVGTVDQFLLLALKQKHLMLRHLGFSKKVVVIDEVHAYDAYMSQYLYQAIRWMGAYGVPVVILSATLPADRRGELVNQYLFGAGYKKRDCTFPESGLETDDYPLITYSDGSVVKQVSEFEAHENKRVKVIRYENEDIIPLIEDLLEGGGIIGIIVNTVRRAQKLAVECADKFGNDCVELLHSAFIATHRIEKEADLIRMIGKDADRPHKKIIIGTQVIEQSLDIDFDVMISDLAPMDLLIQRAGRLHRHRNKNNQPMIPRWEHEFSTLYVLGCSQDFGFEPGSVAVYGRYLLARTQVFLPDEISIPSDISPLVQKVYGGDKKNALDFFEGIENIYEEMKKEHDVLLKNKENKAKTYRLERPNFKSRGRDNISLVGWLEKNHPNESDEMAYAQVRDTQETLEVIALERIGEGYGIVGTKEDISEKIDDPIIAKQVAQQTLRLPNVLSVSYRIDDSIKELEEHKCNYLKKWDSQAWLKGTLGIIFDNEGCFKLNGYILKYDKHYGLIYEKEEK